ncbi:MAG: LD-carboxypeptidase [Pseudomonadota bacterium]
MNRKPKKRPGSMKAREKGDMSRARLMKEVFSEKLKVGIIDIGLSPPALMLEILVGRLGEKGIEVRLSSTLAAGRRAPSPINGIDRKVEAFMEILYDESVSLVISARGGQGCMAFVRALRQYFASSTFKKSFIEAVRRKVYVVSGDATALMLYLVRFGACGFYARHVASGPGAAGDLVRMIDAIASFNAFELPAKTITAGEARGRIMGGSAETVAALAFSRLCATVESKILYLESRGAADWLRGGCIEKLFEKLVAAGASSRLKGLVIGGLPPPAPGQLQLTPWDILHLDLSKLGIGGPVALLADADRDPLRSLIPLGFRTSIVLRRDGRLCLAWVS